MGNYYLLNALVPKGRVMLKRFFYGKNIERFGFWFWFFFLIHTS